MTRLSYYAPILILLSTFITFTLVSAQNSHETRIYGHRPINTHPKSIALTFDDGPNIKYHKKLHAVLRKYSVPATFFYVAKNLETFLDSNKIGDDFLMQVMSDGHLVGSHTWNHKPLDKLITREELNMNFDESERIFGRLMHGKRPFLFREPYNRRTAMSDAEAVKRGYVSINWGKDSDDWRCGNLPEEEAPAVDATAGNATTANAEDSSQIYCEENDHLTKRAKCVFDPLLRYFSGSSVYSSLTGSIVLLHEHKWTVDAMEKFIVNAIADGYKFVSITAFMKPETRQFLWEKYECDSVSDWNDMYFETCKQLQLLPSEGKLEPVETQAQQVAPESEPQSAPVEETAAPVASIGAVSAAPIHSTTPAKVDSDTSDALTPPTSSLLQCESHIYLLIFCFLINFSLMAFLIHRSCKGKGSRLPTVLRISGGDVLSEV